MDRDQVIKAIQDAAHTLGVERLTISAFRRESGISQAAILKHFDMWSDACAAAGIDCGQTRENLIPTPGVSEEECISELHRVSNTLGRKALSSNMFTKHARFSASTVIRRFGSWEKALSLAGLELCEQSKREIQLSEGECVQELQRVANLLGTMSLTQDTFDKNSRFTAYRITRSCGGWAAALEKAGLNLSPNYKQEIPLAQLATVFMQVVTDMNCVPTLVQLVRRSQHAADTFSRNRGGYSAFKREAIEYIFSTPIQIPRNIRSILNEELTRSSNDDVTTPVDATKVTTKVEIGQHGIVPSIAAILKNWHPSSLKNELAYSNALADHLRAVLPDGAHIERERPHEGTPRDIRVAYGDDEVFLEVKYQLQKNTEYDRLVGQIEGLKPRKNKIIIVLIGDTKQKLFGRLKEQFFSYLTEQRVGEERFMVVCVS
jgi:hypothetical protein